MKIIRNFVTVYLRLIVKMLKLCILVASAIVPFVAASPLDGPENDSQEQIQVELIQEEDTGNVINMLKEFFFKDEPMNNYLKIGDSVELENYCTKTIAEKSSFKAVNSRGEIVGVVINGINNKPKPNEPTHSSAADCKDPQFKKILSLMEYIDDRFSTFNLYPNVDKLLDVKILSVNNNYRGHGIAGKLMEPTVQYMRDNNIKLIQVSCSSHYSARVCEKMGLRKVYELPYADYVVNGENPILPANPHRAVQIFVQEIQ